MPLLRSPLAAYRDDLQRLGTTRLTAHDGAAIEIAVHLDRLAHLPATATAARAALREAIDRRLVEIAPVPVVPVNAPREADASSTLARVRALADMLQFAEALELAAVLVRLAERALPCDALELGRLIEHRGRLARFCGDDESSLWHFRDLRRLAARVHSRELTARALLGMAVLQQVRGNYPEMERLARRALRLIDVQEVPLVAAWAHTHLMMRAVGAGDYPSAVRHGWTAYQLGDGRGWQDASALNNLSQVFADAGEPAPALHGFVAALKCATSLAIEFTAWGGIAGAAAALGDHELLALASARVLDLSRIPGHAYYKVQGLTDVALARRLVGLPPAPWSELAAELVAREGFHAIGHRLEEGLRARRDAEPSAERPAPAPVASGRHSDHPEVAAVAASLRSLARVEDAYAHVSASGTDDAEF